jgi:hypothetical protein
MSKVEGGAYKPLEGDIARVKKELNGRLAFGKDTYGALHLALLRCVHADSIDDPEDEEDDSPLSVWQVLGHAVVLQIFAYLLQFVALFILQIFVNNDSMDRFEMVNWKSFHALGLSTSTGVNLVNATNTLNAAINTNTSLDETQEFNNNILGTCDKDGNVPYAIHIFLLVLMVTFVNAIVNAVWGIIIYVLYVETEDTIDPGAFLLKDPKDKLGKKQVVTHASTGAKALIILLDFVPKLVINIMTFWVGAGFLALAGDVAKVVMKCMGISLVSKIPDLVFANLIEEDTGKLVKKTSLAYQKTKDEPHQELKRLWLLPFLKLGLAVLITIFFVHGYYGDIYRLRMACYDYGNYFIAPRCVKYWPCGDTFFRKHFYNGVASLKASGLTSAFP